MSCLVISGIAAAGLITPGSAASLQLFMMTLSARCDGGCIRCIAAVLSGTPDVIMQPVDSSMCMHE